MTKYKGRKTRLARLLVLSCGLHGLAIPSIAAITTTGAVTPTHSGQFYWDPGFWLAIGNESPGTLRIDGTSVITGESVTIGYRSTPGSSATVSGNGSIWQNTRDFTIGNNSEGTLRVENGGYVRNARGRIGFGAGSLGIATITDPGSVWTNNDVLEVGTFGSGVLNIENGGVVNVAQETLVGNLFPGEYINFNNGTLNTNGLQSLTHALNGVGTINTSGIVSNLDLTFDANHNEQQQFILSELPGQYVTVNLDTSSPARDTTLGIHALNTSIMTIADGRAIRSGEGYIAAISGANARATVTGIGSAWDTGRMHIGNAGTSTLDIVNGGRITSGNAVIDGHGDGTTVVRVNGNGSTWDPIGLRVGGYGTGQLIIEDSGYIDSGEGFVGSSATGQGYVKVSGVGSRWEASRINIGHHGYGLLDIDDGGSVTAGSYLTIGRESDGSGTVNLQDGTLIVNREFVKGDGDAVFNFTGGTLKNPMLIDLGQTFFQQGGTFVSNKTSIIGGYTLARGSLVVQLDFVEKIIGRIDPDPVSVTGEVDLLGQDGNVDADLEVILSFAPELNEKFTILSNDGDDAVLGIFEQGYTITSTYDGLTYGFDIDYAAGTGNDIVLTVMSIVPEPSSLISISGCGSYLLMLRRQRL